MAVGCALVVFVSAAGFASLYASASRSREVLVLTRTVGQGQPFTSGDLSETAAAVGPGAGVVPAAEAALLRGKVAAVTVPAGSLLAPADVSTGPTVASGQAAVGLALKPGQLPATGVTTGQPVMLVETGSPGTPLSGSVTGTGTGTGTAGPDTGSASVSPEASVLVGRATVFDVAEPTQSTAASGDTEVSVLVPVRFAPLVATAAAAGQVSLVELATGGSGSAP